MRTENLETVSTEHEPAMVVRLNVHEFQRQVLQKLGSLEAKIDMIVGNGQPGRMKLAEDRLFTLERNDVRRAVYDRIMIAAVTFVLTSAVSAAVAWRSWFGMR